MATTADTARPCPEIPTCPDCKRGCNRKCLIKGWTDLSDPKQWYCPLCEPAKNYPGITKRKTAFNAEAHRIQIELDRVLRLIDAFWHDHDEGIGCSCPYCHAYEEEARLIHEDLRGVRWAIDIAVAVLDSNVDPPDPDWEEFERKHNPDWGQEEEDEETEDDEADEPLTAA